MAEHRILLAESDPAAASAALRLLTDAGYRCTLQTVSSGPEPSQASSTARGGRSPAPLSTSAPSGGTQTPAQGVLPRAGLAAYDAGGGPAVSVNSQQMQRALEELNRELEGVLYVASHDLRSPLLNVLGFAQELARHCRQLQDALQAGFPAAAQNKQILHLLDSDIPEALHFIRASATKMDGLLNGLLQLSRLGRQQLVPTVVDMNQLGRGVVESLKFQVNQSGALVEIGDLPPCYGDALQLHRVFTNLVDNALKYLRPPGPGRVTLSGSVSPDTVVYCVADNGIGIAADHRERVFELFHRLVPDRCAGEGLGLTIAQRIVARHGGKIWVEPVLPSGSCFFVSLPLSIESRRQ